MNGELGDLACQLLVHAILGFGLHGTLDIAYFI